MTKENEEYSRKKRNKKQVRKGTIMKKIKNATKKPSFWYASIIGVSILGVVALYFLISPTANKADASLDINKILTGVKYEAELKETDGKLYMIAVGDELTQEDTVTLASTVKEDEGRELTVYTFSKAPVDKARPEFYQDNLMYQTSSLPNDAYEIQKYLSLPTVDADIEAVKEWQLNAEESYIDTEDVLQAVATVPTSATEEDMVALLKGLDGIIKEMNEEKFDATRFKVKSGLRNYIYSTEHGNVLAQTFNYQMKETK